MKNVIRTMLMAGAFVGIVGLTTANAQVTEALTFTTTFPFIAGNTTFPAGTFTLRPVADSVTMLEISDGRVKAFIETEDMPLMKSEPAKNEAVFNKYHNTYVLSEIWNGDNRTGVQIMKSAAEQREERTHGKPTKQTVSTSRGSH